MIRLLSSLSGSEVDWENVLQVTATGTLLKGRHHLVTITAADTALNLPPAALCAGQMISVEISRATTKFITLDANAVELIDGQQTRIMWAGESAVLLCDGVGWSKIAGKSLPMNVSISRSTTAAYTVNAYNDVLMDTVDSGLQAMFNSANKTIKIIRPSFYLLQGMATINNASVFNFYARIHDHTLNKRLTANSQYSSYASAFPVAAVALPANQEVKLQVWPYGAGSNYAGDYISAVEMVSW